MDTNLSNSFRIRVVSDLHIDSWSNFPNLIQQTDDEILIIAGDIGNPFDSKYEDFLRYIRSKFHHVFITPGNHEYYGFDMKLQEKKFISLCEKYEIYSLIRNVYYVNKVRIIGCTLWSNIDEKSKAIKTHSGIRRLRNNGKWIGVSKFKSLHEYDRKWLENELKRSNRDTIVVTHYPILPIAKPDNEFYRKYTSLYVSDYSSYFSFPVKIWISGHTHHPLRYEEHERVYVSNPRGKSDENVDFYPEFYIDILN